MPKLEESYSILQDKLDKLKVALELPRDTDEKIRILNRISGVKKDLRLLALELFREGLL